jgi:acyl-CoA synthetase (AMP-forming)/AMP-acid ligase II
MTGPIDHLALWDLVERRAATSSGARCAIDEADRELTYGELRERAGRVAAALAARGIGRDTPVVWILPTWIEAFVLTAALARLGALQVPVIPILREREVGFILRRTGARHVVVPGQWRGVDYPALARAAAAEAGVDDLDLLVVDRSVSGALPEADPAMLVPWSALRPPAEAAPLRWIFFTSGTTSEPKGVKHTDATVAACAHRLDLRFDMRPADRNALVFPVTHIGGISWLMGGLMAGYSHILVEAFSGESSCAVLRRNGVTVAGSGPAFWMAYVAEQRRLTGGGRAFPELRALVGGGAAKPPTLDAEVREVLGVPLVTGYGSTECPAVAHSGVHDPHDVLLTDGYALDDAEIAIAAPDGALLPAGEVGEIVVRGPMLFLGYLDPAHDVGAFDAEGRFRSGDLGMLDERGLLRVTGRVKDIIIRKGENISAKEVEDALHLHPAVADVAAIPLPDRERGELCCAVLVLRDGANAPSLDDVVAHCTSLRLARQKIPERIEVVDALPRNSTGKILKQVLVDRFA